MLLAPGAPPSRVSKEMIQLQTQVQALQDQVARMQQSIDMNMGVMKNLIEQSADSVNKMNAAVNDLQNKMQGLTADNGGKIDQLSGQVQSLHDSVDELKSRMAKISKQLDDMQQGGQNLAAGQPGMTAAPGAAPGGAPAAGAPDNGAAAAAPPADVLYNNALRDYNSGKYDLSSQEFAQYLQYYAQHRSGRQRAVLPGRHRVSPGQLPAGGHGLRQGAGAVSRRQQGRGRSVEERVCAAGTGPEGCRRSRVEQPDRALSAVD